MSLISVNNIDQQPLTRCSARDSISKKSKTAAFPSGLVANWKQKTAAQRVSAKVTAPASISVEQTLGGLNDEDADAVQPNSEAFELSGKSRNEGRKNDVCIYHTTNLQYETLICLSS